LIVVFALAIVVAATSSTAAFGAYNAAWDGASQLQTEATASGTESHLVSNTTAYGRFPAETTAALVLSPDRPYTDAEIRRIRGFVTDGGTLIVAEDVGPGGNELLRALGTETRFNGTRLRDETHYYQSPNLPLARNVADRSPYTTDVSRLTLNYGTVLEFESLSNVSTGSVSDSVPPVTLVRSSEVSYLDRNDDETLNTNETLARRPVAAVEPLGEGRVVSVADSSVFINSMLERPGNRQFTRNLFGLEERVLLDYSHTASIPPLSLALLGIRNSPGLQVLIGLVGVLVVFTWGRGLVTSRLSGDSATEAGPPTTATDEDLRAYLAAQHPDWDAERIDRVIASLSRGDPTVVGDTQAEIAAQTDPTMEVYDDSLEDE
jgi:hypothetical protein